MKKVPKTNDDRLIYLGPSSSDSFYLYPTTQEIQKIISGLKTKHSSGTDEIPSFLIKSLPTNIISILTNIFNSSISADTSGAARNFQRGGQAFRVEFAF